jgi:hypothetical protein
MPTHYQGTAKKQAALDTYIKLMRAADSVTARLNRLLADRGPHRESIWSSRSASITWAR